MAPGAGQIRSNPSTKVQACPGCRRSVWEALVASVRSWDDVRVRICYNCGKPADSKDHLPPKSFFPKPVPLDLITMPCCSQCNNGFSLLDEKFRIFAASDEQRNSAGLRILMEKVFSPNSTKGRPFLEIARSLRNVVVTDGSKRLVKPKLSMPISETRQFVFRLTRGLIAKFYPNIHSPAGKFHMEYLSDPNKRNPAIDLALKAAPYMERQELGDGVFQFWRFAQGRRSIWIFCFYRGATFSVLHSLDDHPLFD